MSTKILTLLIAIVLGSLMSGCIEVGRSTVADTVYDVGEEGLVWKTVTVYLTNDHPSAGGKGLSGYSAKYTVDKDNNATLSLLNEALVNKRMVKIYYTTELFYLPWDHTTDAVALIYKVEYLNTG